VGRIAAVINRTHNEHHKDKIGFFGFFDCIDDQEIANTLFDKAADTLREKGFESARGPYNPTINDECGLLTEGFDSAPFLMMPFNPEYYLKLYEGAGLQTARDLLAFYMTTKGKAPARIEKIAKRVQKSTGISLRKVNLSKLSEELPLIRDLYNSTLSRNWGFVPITNEDLKFAAQDLKPIADPNMLIFAEKNNQVVGFALTLPNINEILLKTRNSSRWMRVLKFLWHMKVNPPKEARLVALGVHPDYRNSGIAALFYYESLMRAKVSYIGGEMSWVEANNNVLLKSLRLMGGEPYKKYRIYEKTLLN